MRKILSKQEEEKKSKKNQMVVGTVLVLIMITSLLGYSINSMDGGSEDERINYNGFEFTGESGLWATDIGDFKFYFKYNPNEVEQINSTLNFLNSYTDKPLYIYSENSESDTEIYRNVFYQNSIVQRIQYACPENEKCEESVPVKNCTSNFIIIKENENTEIKQEENCVFILGKKEDLTKLTDSFLYRIIGIQ